MRDVLISLKPYYYYLIGENIKKVEVRKSYPKAEDWSKNSWFYMSRDEKSFAKIPKEFQKKYRKHFGKVGMRFVCDRISGGSGEYAIYHTEGTCLTPTEIADYIGDKYAYYWHITDLVVYDEPRELSEFTHGCPDNVRSCSQCKYSPNGWDCTPIKTAPQSWIYVNENEPRQTAD